MEDEYQHAGIIRSIADALNGNDRSRRPVIFPRDQDVHVGPLVFRFGTSPGTRRGGWFRVPPGFPPEGNDDVATLPHCTCSIGKEFHALDCPQYTAARELKHKKRNRP